MKLLLACSLPLVGAYSFLPVTAPRTRSSAVLMAVEPKKVAIGVIGTGLVGGELLQQIEQYGPALKKQGLDIKVASISKTRITDGERQPWMLCDDEEGCTLDSVSSAIEDPEAGEAGDFLKMADFLLESTPNAIIVDATASDEVSNYYSKWLAKGVHVVTPNKKAGSGDLARWKACTDAMEATGAMWGDETTVGAGLPILNTLRTDLLATGDTVNTIVRCYATTRTRHATTRHATTLHATTRHATTRHATTRHATTRHATTPHATTLLVHAPLTHAPPCCPLSPGRTLQEGIFSGTLSYIFNTYKPGMKFSDVINDAKENGFTEPDPRDDLSGTDVARKVTILARACGIPVELDDVPVSSLVPAALEDWSPAEGEVLADAFIEQMKAYDAEKDELISSAEAAGMVLRYVGVVDVKAKTVSVELKQYPKTHPFAGTQFADNICAFGTERYTPQPLVIQGPGAGAAVTAAGIFADVIKVAKAC